MKRLIRNEMIFSVIYFLFAFTVILFYNLSKSREIVYPILLSFFFYVVYIVISLGYSYAYVNNLKKLSFGSLKCSSFNLDKQDAYDVINKIYDEYNEKFSHLKAREEENRRFISSCVHNLKTPVTVSNLLLQRVENKEIDFEEAFKGVKTENERISEALSMILETQRLEEFTNDYAPVKINIYEELSLIINENKSLFINSHIFPVLNGEEEYIFFDKKWNKVLINQIISNAVKYSLDSKDRHVYFNIISENKKVILEIIDKGIGISEYDLPKVFEPFFTGENGRKNYYSSGIGLYLCKMICQKLGQQIDIDSKKGEGTRVRITYLTKL